MGVPPIGSRAVEQTDVAKHAGVSQKTVSRVVNNAPHVRPDVRAKVLAAIEELGYRPNVAAQALARNRTHMIGMLAIGTTLYGPSRRVFSIEHAARRHGYGLALASLPDLEPGTIEEAVQDLLNRGVEGLVIEIPTHTIPVDLTGLGDLPVVKSGDRIAKLSRQVVVDVDQFGAAREATEHLLGLGHDTVWHVGGPRDWDAAESRLQGWRSALRAAGRRVPNVLRGDWSARSGYAEGRKLADRADVTAVFVANDHMAMGLMRAFVEAGRQIPADASVIGYDDVPEAEFQIVPLSTVGSDSDATAERALAELVAMIEGAAPDLHEIRLQASLTIRSSTGPAPTTS
jgi:DNA-binding LacI/PurR family transcriptional regulator